MFHSGAKDRGVGASQGMVSLRQWQTPRTARAKTQARLKALCGMRPLTKASHKAKLKAKR